MKYLFTLLATCFVLGLSAQSSNDNVNTLVNDQIELVKKDLVSQNDKLSQNDELKQEDKLRITNELTLTEAQVADLKKALVKNATAMLELENSDVAVLEKNERRNGLESARDYIIFQALNPQQQTAFKKSKK